MVHYSNWLSENSSNIRKEFYLQPQVAEIKSQKIRYILQNLRTQRVQEEEYTIRLGGGVFYDSFVLVLPRTTSDDVSTQAQLKPHRIPSLPSSSLRGRLQTAPEEGLRAGLIIPGQRVVRSPLGPNPKD